MVVMGVTKRHYEELNYYTFESVNTALFKFGYQMEI